MWGKIARWLLPASLALNLFFVVVAVRHRPFLHPHPPDPASIVDFLRPNLSAADTAILQQSFAAHESVMQQAARAGDAFPDHIRAALTATPFDADALKAALTEGQSDHRAMEDAMAAALVEAAGKMSAEGRAALAKRPFGPPGGPHHGPGFPHDGPPPPPPPK